MATRGYWRDIALTPQLFFVDAYAIFPLVLFFLHIRMWTFYLAISFIAFFTILGKFNFTIPVFFRWLKNFFAGPYKISRPWWRR